MYRIQTWDDLDSTGFFEYLAQPCALAVEWSENIAAALPPNCIRVTLQPGAGENDRSITTEHSENLI
jgi:tRNA threonylcarbamoyladenosine biosynthesis protein TsaE